MQLNTIFAFIEERLKEARQQMRRSLNSSSFPAQCRYILVGKSKDGKVTSPFDSLFSWLQSKN